MTRRPGLYPRVWRGFLARISRRRRQGLAAWAAAIGFPSLNFVRAGRGPANMRELAASIGQVLLFRVAFAFLYWTPSTQVPQIRNARVVRGASPRRAQRSAGTRRGRPQGGRLSRVEKINVVGALAGIVGLLLTVGLAAVQLRQSNTSAPRPTLHIRNAGTYFVAGETDTYIGCLTGDAWAVDDPTAIDRDEELYRATRLLPGDTQVVLEPSGGSDSYFVVDAIDVQIDRYRPTPVSPALVFETTACASGGRPATTLDFRAVLDPRFRKVPVLDAPGDSVALRSVDVYGGRPTYVNLEWGARAAGWYDIRVVVRYRDGGRERSVSLPHRFFWPAQDAEYAVYQHFYESPLHPVAKAVLPQLFEQLTDGPPYPPPPFPPPLTDATVRSGLVNPESPSGR